MFHRQFPNLSGCLIFAAILLRTSSAQQFGIDYQASDEAAGLKEHTAPVRYKAAENDSKSDAAAAVRGLNEGVFDVIISVSVSVVTPESEHGPGADGHHTNRTVLMSKKFGGFKGHG